LGYCGGAGDHDGAEGGGGLFAHGAFLIHGARQILPGYRMFNAMAAQLFRIRTNWASAPPDAADHEGGKAEKSEACSEQASKGQGGEQSRHGSIPVGAV
jgi:hypothetical protein